MRTLLDGIKITILTVVAAAAFAGCDEDPDLGGDGGDYSQCGFEVLKNQQIVCDDLMEGVEDLCGFSLTVDVCSCADTVAACTTDTAWLEQVMTCRQNATDCSSWILCLEGVGESPSGCSNPTEWGCITTESAGTDQ